MSQPFENQSRLALTVQPLVFETGIEQTPYSTLGTVFLVAYEGRPYVLTTRHALTPHKTGPICIFPSDTSQHILPLKDVFFVPLDKTSEMFQQEPEDTHDLAVISIDISRITEPELAQASLLDLARISGDWKSNAYNSEFTVIGFPEDRSFVYYDEEILKTERATLYAKYIGTSPISQYLHEIEIIGSDIPATFSGFSGSPVFSLHTETDIPATPTLCGMAIRGSHQSRKIHFLDRSILLEALKTKRLLEDKEADIVGS